MNVNALKHLSLRWLSLSALVLVALCVLMFALITWIVMQQSQRDLAALEQVNVQQSSSLNRLHIAGLEGLHRLDRALERQLRPSLGDPVEALEAVEHELSAMAQSLATFLAATADTPHASLRDTIEQKASALIAAMHEQLNAVQTGDRGGYRQLTLDALTHSQAFSEEARAFYQLADHQGTSLMSAAEQRARTIGQLLLLGIGLAFGLLGLMAWVGQRHVLLPINRLIHHFRTMAAGDLSATVPDQGSNEIGQLYQALDHMQRALIETVSELHGNSRHIFDSAQRLALGNEDLAIRTRQQNASHEATAANLDELTQNVATTAGYAADANALTLKAATQTQQGSQLMAEFLTTMQEIHGRSRKVDEIVSVIDAIAFQTNILALNASVEAARAGEQGKGFAVVADEVRALASRSADAARQIQTLLAASASSIEQGHTLSTQAGQGMQAIVASAEQANSIMRQIADAASEQHRHIEHLNSTLHEQTQVSRANARQVETTAQDALSLEAAAERMREQAARFKVARSTQDGGFVWQASQQAPVEHSSDNIQRAPALLQ
ncbi:methyl-accepting chemotaxis sensory transducer with TarH sensor [Vreelandella songnenensis]|uniref:Methyl-accepting chemotaxis sensory transducer with TarH sensor n=1 Tax=Vreelandella songnenensis TaxID=1176243 RepID=A0A2T0UQZ4_9GAMM|nr:methyl-accepting chemotaxis protein [Halomonas songnenensis]PRY60351.1 methyl-accepting chemotaxis sensory transducer with TarH sensor [Halomonas songnenensis]